MGFSKGSDSDSSSVSNQRVWGTQAPFLQNLFAGGQNLMNQQLGQPGPAAQGMVNQMLPQMQQGFSALMTPGNNPMLSNYASQLGRDFSQNILPGINRGAQGVGQLGGSRQGVAEGVAATGMGNMLSEFAGNQYAGDMNRLLGGLGQAQGMMNFGMSPYTASWLPLQMQAGLLGSPTVLGESTSEGSSGGGFSFSL